MILVIGQIISLFGSSIQRFSLSLYLLDVTGSARIFSGILALSMLPYIVFAPIAGVLADRMNRKYIMVILDFLSGILLCIYAVILLSDRDHYNIVAGVMLLLSVFYTLYAPAVTASIPQIVSESSLMQANGIVQQVASMSNFLGPILAGVFYSLWGIKAIIIINALSFFFSAILELFLEIPHTPATPKAQKVSISRVIYEEMKAGYRYLKEDNPIVFRMILTSGLYNLFLVPIFSIGSPYIIKIILNMPAQTYGMAEGIIALGMILGGLIISLRPRLVGIERIYYILFPACLSLVVMSLSVMLPLDQSSFRWASLGLFTLGGMSVMLALGMANVISMTYIQQASPSHMLGKISAFATAFATCCIPLGQAVFGQLLEAFGSHLWTVLLVAALCSFGATLLVRWNVRQIKATSL